MGILVGKKAPAFRAKAVINGDEIVNDFSLEQYIGKKHVILFFYPKDFTFVCPTELHAFQEYEAEFKKRNVEVVACSTDTEYSHWAWLQVPKDKGGINGVKYPIIADTNKTIASDYDVLAGEYFYDEKGKLVATGELVSYRGLFLIDKNGMVKHQIVNDMPLGRNVEEAIRMVDALQHVELKGEVCPANWQKGKNAMSASREGVSSYLEAN